MKVPRATGGGRDGMAQAQAQARAQEELDVGLGGVSEVWSVQCACSVAETSTVVVSRRP